MREEDGIGVALEASEDVGAEVIDRANEVFAAHEEVGKEEANDDGADPGTHKAYISHISICIHFCNSLGP